MLSYFVLLIALYASSSYGGNMVLVRPISGNAYPSVYRSSIIPPSQLGAPPNYRSVVLVPALIAPIPETSSDSDQGSAEDKPQKGMRSDSVEEPNNGTDTATKKPRCLTSLFTWYAKKKVVGAMQNFNAPDMPDFPDFRAPEGSGLQGGINSPGGSSQLTPDLTQANSALHDAQLMEGQVNSAQAQLNANLAGVPNSGIPLSPSLLRDDSSSSVNNEEVNAPTLQNSGSGDYGIITSGYRSFNPSYSNPQPYYSNVMYAQPGAYFYS